MARECGLWKLATGRSVEVVAALLGRMWVMYLTPTHVRVDAKTPAKNGYSRHVVSDEMATTVDPYVQCCAYVSCRSAPI